MISLWWTSCRKQAANHASFTRLLPCYSSEVIDAEKLFADLTPPQAEAVRHVDGPLLIIAGAGSGKTRVLTRRVAHLVSLGIPATSVLAITFTNKAAGEMKQRIEKLLQRNVRD